MKSLSLTITCEMGNGSSSWTTFCEYKPLLTGKGFSFKLTGKLWTSNVINERVRLLPYLHAFNEPLLSLNAFYKIVEII